MTDQTMQTTTKTEPSNDRHNELVKGYFDDHAKEWSNLYDEAQRINDVVLSDRKNYAINFVKEQLPQGSHVLDAGCGAGLAALELVQSGYNVHGVDISDKMIDLCLQNFRDQNIPEEQYSFTCGGMDQKDFAEGPFDGILALGFLQYQPDENVALRQLWQLLKPSGTLVISGPVKTRLSEGFGVLSGAQRGVQKLLGKNKQAPSESVQVLREISCHSYSVGRFKSLLKNNGFQIIKFKGHGFVHFPMISHRLGFKGELFLHQSLSRLAKITPIGRWANDLIVLAKKR